jgi:hypothetical protein
VLCAFGLVEQSARGRCKVRIAKLVAHILSRTSSRTQCVGH